MTTTSIITISTIKERKRREERGEKKNEKCIFACCFRFWFLLGLRKGIVD